MTVDSKEKQVIVYLYTFANGKKYVGKTAYPEKRCLKYQQYYKQQPIYKALKKAKRNGDRVDLTHLSGYVSNKAAAGIEKHYIALYRTNICRYGKDFGYNLTDGGEGTFGYKYTEEQRAKISATVKAALNRPEVKAKQSEATKAARNRPDVKARYKATMDTPEWKAKQSEAAKLAQNKHEVKVSARLAALLQYHEKRLEAAGILPVLP